MSDQVPQGDDHAAVTQQFFSPCLDFRLGLLRLQHHHLVRQTRTQQGYIAGLGHEIHGPQGQGVLYVAGLVLARQHQYLDMGIEGDEFVDQFKALFGAVGHGRQSQVYERQGRDIIQLLQQFPRLFASGGLVHLIVRLQGQGQGFDDQGIVVDEQQGRLVRQRNNRLSHAFRQGRSPVFCQSGGKYPLLQRFTSRW